MNMSRPPEPEHADNIGSWPLPVKIFGATVLVFVIIGFLLLELRHQDELDVNLSAKSSPKQEQLELTQEGRVREEAAQSSQPRRALKQQLEDIKETFGDLLQATAEQDRGGRTAGGYFTAGTGRRASNSNCSSPVPRTAGATSTSKLPIQIRVVGDYHEFGNFISGVSDLPRIVTSHDVKIKPRTTSDGTVLVMETTAKTYRYMDDSDLEDEAL